MKHIRKRGCPQAYVQWCAGVAGTDKSDWREVPAKQKEALFSVLIAEQGSLCAYTMRRIDITTAHIEHIKPESRCRTERTGSDLDYDNLVACYPRYGMGKKYRYGAQHKADWWKDNGIDFVSPLHAACEKRFSFHLDGTINAVGNHSGARTTINVLALDHPTLIDDRKRAIEEFVYGPRGDDPLSKSKASQAKAAICKMQQRRIYYEFCIAILHALEEHLKRLDKSARRRRLVQKRK